MSEMTSLPSSTTTNAAPNESIPTPTTGTNNTSSEESLRTELHERHKKIIKREPLDASYNFLLLSTSNVKPPKLDKDKAYKKFNANLRQQVETYEARYGVSSLQSKISTTSSRMVGRYRPALDETKMRASFTLRESKKLDQEAFINATLAANDARRIHVYPPNHHLHHLLVEEKVHNRKIEAMALGLQERERKRLRREKESHLLHAAKMKLLNMDKETTFKKEQESMQGELDNKKINSTTPTHEQDDKQIQEAIELAKQRERDREQARKLAQEKLELQLQKEKEEAMRQARLKETPQQALHRLYEPIFRALWDMEFENLYGTNPFRIVIDKENCVSMGAPDYCDIITQPMNLTYIQQKVNDKHYETLKDFFEDVELLIRNALLYNSDPNNPYHVAAKVLKKEYKRLAKRVILQLQHQPDQQSKAS